MLLLHSTIDMHNAARDTEPVVMEPVNVSFTTQFYSAKTIIILLYYNKYNIMLIVYF